MPPKTPYLGKPDTSLNLVGAWEFSEACRAASDRIEGLDLYRSVSNFDDLDFG